MTVACPGGSGDASDEVSGPRGQGDRGRPPDIAATPDTQPRGIDLRPLPQIFGGADDVVQFAGTGGAEALRLAEIQAIAGAAAEIDRQDDITPGGEELVRLVEMRVRFEGIPGRKGLAVDPHAL